MDPNSLAELKFSAWQMDSKRGLGVFRTVPQTLLHKLYRGAALKKRVCGVSL
jgi:hypothetical protein